MIGRMPRRSPSALPLFGQLELPFGLPPPADEPLRRIQLGSRIVEYLLLRGRRRTLGVSVDQRGVRVGAPARVSLADIERFLRDNGSWLLEKVDEWGRDETARRITVVSGERLPVLGEGHILQLEVGPWRAHWHPGRLELAVPPRLTPAQALRMALQERATGVFRERAAPLAAALGVALPRLALSEAQARWGSCSHRGGIRLNWRLVHLDPALIDYVIAHELAHLIEMNHSRRFWAVVERVCPDHRQRREELARRARALPHF